MDTNERREEIRKRREEIRQKMATALDRAIDDAEFRRQLLDDPRAAYGVGEGATRDIPEAFKEQRSRLLQEVIARAKDDSGFRTALTDEPRKALWAAGFGPQIEQLRAELPQPEVAGYSASWWGGEWIWSGLVNPWGSGGSGGGTSWGGGGGTAWG